MLAGRTGPVGEHENLVGCAQLAERFERVGDPHACRALERDRPRVARGERGVELGQPCDQLLAIRRRQRWPRGTEPVECGPVEVMSAGGRSPVLVQVSVGYRCLRRAGEGRHQPLLRRGELPGPFQQRESLAGPATVGAPGGDDRAERCLLVGEPVADRGPDLVMSTRPAVQQHSRYAGDLEVSPPATGTPEDPKAELVQLTGEFGAVRGAELAAVNQP